MKPGGSRVLDPPVDRHCDHFRGRDGAPITLLEYGSYASPGSARAQPAIERVRVTVGKDLRLVFRHFPLDDEHPHAQVAAEAAEAAGAQGRFWEMHHHLFANQDAIQPAALHRYARELGLDGDRFDADLRSRRHSDRVRRDLDSGVRSGVQGTPTFFIDGERYGGAFDSETLIDRLLEAAFL